MSDPNGNKELVKTYYRGRLHEDLAPKTYCIFYNYEEILEANIPTPCVIKPAHLSGAIFLSSGIDDLSAVDHETIRQWFRKNLYDDVSRERNYRYLEPTVICEELISTSAAVKDYKIYCFDGKPRVVDVHVDRHGDHKQRLYTVDWEPLPLKYDNGGAPLAEVEPEPPELRRAIRLAERLAEEFEFIRVDVYLSDGHILLGEMTNVPSNAHGRFDCADSERAFMHLLRTGEYK